MGLKVGDLSNVVMNQFSYQVLPPAIHGGKYRAFLFEYVFFKAGIYGYAGQSVQNTIWMKELEDSEVPEKFK